MMIVRDIYPYDEFVKPFISEEEDENTSQEPSNPGGGDEGGSEQPDTPPETPDPEQPGGEEPENPGDIEDSGDSEETQNPSTPDMNDKTTKELVDGLIDAVFRLDIGTVIENLTTLVKMYGLNNFGSFLRDYAD